MRNEPSKRDLRVQMLEILIGKPDSVEEKDASYILECLLLLNRLTRHIQGHHSNHLILFWPRQIVGPHKYIDDARFLAHDLCHDTKTSTLAFIFYTHKIWN